MGTLRIELSQLQDDSSSKSFGATLSDDLDGTNDYQSVTALREKVKKLEYEIQSLRSSSNKEASAEGKTYLHNHRMSSLSLENEANADRIVPICDCHGAV